MKRVEMIKELRRLKEALLEDVGFPETCRHCGEGQIPETLLDFEFCPDCSYSYYE